MERSSSFSDTPKHRDRDSEAKEEALHHLPKVLEEIDHFLHNTSTEAVPDCVLLLPKLLDSMMDNYNGGSHNHNQNHKSKFGEEPEDDQSFLDVIDRISKLSATLTTSTALDKTSSILEKAMCFLERDLIALMQNPKSQSKKTSSSFGSLQFLENEEDEEFPAFSPDKISILNKIVTTMICAGYQPECCIAFANLRRSAFKTALQRFGYNVSLSMEDIHKMQWESLEEEIATWNRVVRHCTTALFIAERRLYDSVFLDQISISHTLFSDLARSVVIHFLNFAQGVVLMKPSAEKLFKFLDMYETLKDMELGIINTTETLLDRPAAEENPDPIDEQCGKEELAYEITIAKGRIVEAIVAMFLDLENSIKSDNQRIAVPNGAIHPLARYVMNYLKYACEYKDTLEQVFKQCLVDDVNKGQGIQIQNPDQGKMEDGTPKTSPLAVQLMTIMDLLDENVERKSRLYRDPALRYVFLMNNGRYIVQKIKGCAELHESMGDNWCRKKQSGLRLYHKSYQRETWSKVMQCLNPESLLQGSGSRNKVSKQELKERFKCFNGMFEEIHKTQSTWVVSDEQLRSELRVSLTALVIPAYRSFFGRFKHHLQSGRNVDKYIKYHPEDIETLIQDLFDGSSTSMGRRRT